MEGNSKCGITKPFDSSIYVYAIGLEYSIPVAKFGIFVDAWPSLISVVAIISAVQQYRHQPPLRGAKIMVHLRGMVRSAWYMVQVSKLWYDYIIMVRSGNAASDSPESRIGLYALVSARLSPRLVFIRRHSWYVYSWICIYFLCGFDYHNSSKLFFLYHLNSSLQIAYAASSALPRKKKRVSETVSPKVMHRIRSETLGKTFGETLWRETSRQGSHRDAWWDSWLFL